MAIPNDTAEYINQQQLILLEEFCRFTSEMHQITNYPEDYQMVGGFDALANLLDHYTVKWELKGVCRARFVGQGKMHPYADIYALGAELFRRILGGKL